MSGLRRLTATSLLLILFAAGGLLGAAGPAAARSLTFHHNDDWLHLWAVLGQFQTKPPTVPVVYLLGGSAAREALVSGPSCRAPTCRSVRPPLDREAVHSTPGLPPARPDSPRRPARRTSV